MTIEDILAAIAKVEACPTGRGVELRVSFSELVIRRLRALNWTQKRLAKESGKKESYISRVLNGDQNCSFDKAGEILFALGTHVRFAEEKPESVNSETPMVLSPFVPGPPPQWPAPILDRTNVKEGKYKKTAGSNAKVCVRASFGFGQA